MTRFNMFTDNELDMMEEAFCNGGLKYLVDEIRRERRYRQGRKRGINMDDIELVIKISKEAYEQIIEAGEMDYLEIMTAIENGVLFQKICDRENSEIKNEVKDLSKRVETLEKQIKEDKEEQLKKLNAELDYAKFRCAL